MSAISIHTVGLKATSRGRHDNLACGSENCSKLTQWEFHLQDSSSCSTEHV